MPSSPHPWLVFLAGPLVALIGSYVGVLLANAEIKVTLRSVETQQASLEDKITRIGDGLTRHENSIGMLSATNQGILRELEAIEKRSADRYNQLMPGRRQGGPIEQPAAEHAILRFQD